MVINNHRDNNSKEKVRIMTIVIIVTIVIAIIVIILRLIRIAMLVRVVSVRWTPHPVIVTIMDNKDHIRVLLYSYCTTITGWGVLLRYLPGVAEKARP